MYRAIYAPVYQTILYNRSYDILELYSWEKFAKLRLSFNGTNFEFQNVLSVSRKKSNEKKHL